MRCKTKKRDATHAGTCLNIMHNQQDFEVWSAFRLSYHKTNFRFVGVLAWESFYHPEQSETSCPSTAKDPDASKSHDYLTYGCFSSSRTQAHSQTRSCVSFCQKNEPLARPPILLVCVLKGQDNNWWSRHASATLIAHSLSKRKKHARDFTWQQINGSSWIWNAWRKQ